MMEKQAILSHFSGDFLPFFRRYLPDVQKNGQGYKACCPFHEDDNPSMSIEPGTGKFFCHGCNAQGDILSFYARIKDLNVKTDFNAVLDGIAGDFGIASKARQEIGRRTHNYPEYRKTIISFSDGSKTAFFERFENGSWIKGLNGHKQTIYNSDASKEPGSKYLSESEKDADCLKALGLPALSFGGAENWKPEYADILAGQEVVILPHNDEPGRKSGDRVARDLTGKGCKVKVIPSETWGQHKGADVADWIQAGHTREDLLDLVAGSPQQEQAKPRTIRDAILPAAAFVHVPVEPRGYYLHPWLKQKSLVEIVAPRGIGKTWAAESIALGACSGNGFGPWAGADSVRGLYLDAEMAIQDQIERLTMLDAPPETPLFVYSNDFAHSLGLPPAHLGNEKWRREFKSFLIEEKIELLVFDNNASLTPGLDENSKQEWDPVNQYLLDLRRSGITVILVHHAGKSGAQRGTSGREDNLDIVIELRKPQNYTPEDGCRFIMHFSKHRLPQKELHLINDIEFKLIPFGDKYTWAWNDVKKETKKECLRLLADGNDQKTICTLLGASKGYVSKLKTDFLKKGFLSEKGEILPAGWLFLGNKEGNFEETQE